MSEFDDPLPDAAGRQPAAVPPPFEVLVRRRRRAGAAKAGLIALAAAGSVAIAGIALRDEPGPESLALAPSPTASPSGEPMPTETPEPTARSTLQAPAAHPTTSTPAMLQAPSPSVAPKPSASPTCGPDEFASCPDGKPGWGTGYVSCHDAVAGDVPAGTARAHLFEGVEATFRLADDQVRAGARLAGSVQVHNSRTDRVSLTLGAAPMPYEAYLYGPHGGAIHGSDALGSLQLDLEPGETESFELGVAATSCADTYEQKELPLPTGRYAAGREFAFSDAHTLPPSEPSGSASSTPTASPSPTAAQPAPSSSPPPKQGSFVVRVVVSVV